MEGLRRLNALPEEKALEELLRCCGATRWAEALIRLRPFREPSELLAAAGKTWDGLGPADWLEAFSHHPRIGDREALRTRFASTRVWAAGEQSGVAEAEERVLDGLAEGNQAYEARFGYIFIVCATGKTAGEMLDLLRERLRNDAETELRVAAAEQAKITRLRLEKLLAAGSGDGLGSGGSR